MQIRDLSGQKFKNKIMTNKKLIYEIFITFFGGTGITIMLLMSGVYINAFRFLAICVLVYGFRMLDMFLKRLISK